MRTHYVACALVWTTGYGMTPEARLRLRRCMRRSWTSTLMPAACMAMKAARCTGWRAMGVREGVSQDASGICGIRDTIARICWLCFLTRMAFTEAFV